MLQLFQRKIGQAKSCWMKFAEVEGALRDQWDRTFKLSGMQASTTVFIVRGDFLEQKKLLERNDHLIQTVRGLVADIPPYSAQIHIFMLTDHKGRVIDVIGDEETLTLLDNSNVGTGTSFALEHAGVNAVSFSMETERMVAVEGSEHHLKMLSDWTCVCAPIKSGSETIAYLDISFGSGTDVSFAALLLGQIIKRVDSALRRRSPDIQKEKLFERFGEFGLTPREKEVGFRWLNNEPTAQIAAELFISEGTVRNMIKKVYAKTGVHDKGKFMKRFWGI